MNERAISVLKNIRMGLQVMAEPVDRFTRFLNYKKGYPPLWIRQKVGSLNDFEGSGGEYMAYLKILCNLRPGVNVLDVGCGCGLMCLHVNENPSLPDYISPGRYVGLDTDYELVSWCKKHLASENCSFYWLGSSKSFSFKASHGDFDIVLCKSLFTHLLKPELESYLAEIYKLLKVQGKCLATFFLLNDSEYGGRYTFKGSREGDFSLERYGNPRAAVAYEEDYLRRFLSDLGFVSDIHYGSWRGDNKGLSFQDIVILGR